jgi:hypothetical protein
MAWGRTAPTSWPNGGIAIDTSVRAAFDYSYSGGGPNFRDHPAAALLDRIATAGLMELPLTTVYWGPLRAAGDVALSPPVAGRRCAARWRRIGLLERIPLTPEGVTIEEAIARRRHRAIDQHGAAGAGVLVPQPIAGCRAIRPMSAARTISMRFYDWWRQLFAILPGAKCGADQRERPDSHRWSLPNRPANGLTRARPTSRARRACSSAVRAGRS